MRQRTSWKQLLAGWLVVIGASSAVFGSEHAYSPQQTERYDDVIVALDVMVPMRDGVRLATDIYRPAREGRAVDGRFPTLLCRTPYGTSFRNPDATGYGCSEEPARSMARHGYVVLTQDVRGRFDSEGEFYAYVNEGPDGYETVEWAAAQPFSNGDVGTFGASYYAATQNALAAERPPHLKAMFQRVGSSHYWLDGAGSGGAFALRHNLAYALYLASTGQEADRQPALKTVLQAALQRDNLAAWLWAYPYRPHGSPLELVPSYQRWFQDWVDHSGLDDYWTQNGYAFEPYYDNYPDIPVYFVGGWYDIFLRGALNGYSMLSAIQSSEKRLLVGPWTHAVGPRTSGDVDFGVDAAIDLEAEQLRWFDHVLRGKDTGFSDEPPVRVFVMGGGDGSRTTEGRHRHDGRWRSLGGWPPAAAESRAYYLQPNGRLDLQAPRSIAEPSVFTFDPTDPVPTIGGKVSSGNNMSPAGPYDQQCDTTRFFPCKDNLPLAARRDVLVFQTAPLQEDVVVIGPLTVTLWIASSAVDTDFTAKLVDVHPPGPHAPAGYSMLLADSIVRARYRDSLATAKPLAPDEIYEIEIDLLGTATRFKKGHRIRLDVSSSNYPFFDVNPNTGERPGHHTHMAPARNSVYHDRMRPSKLQMLILPEP